ncbi:small glutamine-rich tetratricopeptide repeat-containing protein 2 isoform X1 [Elaeis guineensis]|uniref:Small glutamine-rich tetratricopeptide repeat-containing protein 2 isoform X2 n=1 Tax=Elaeis guineensis var. tenera TaxID=51953 RepID=A0A6I9S0D6_ELAGV|nr:small glutamine-rich tetratricopeptide repeat-containing protein 2 isoform X2 [Elaeis guineensis]
MAVSFSSYGFQTASPVSWRRWRAAASTVEEVEIRVCVNRSCGRQGSREMLAVLSALAPTGIAVTSCGCLGRCGAGPNLAVLPAGFLVSHCGTASRAAQLLADLCGSAFDPQRNLEAFTLRKKGENELEKGNAAEAEALLSQAIGLEPSGGLHYIYKSRSSARLAIGDNAGAFDDANEASRIDSKYPQAYVCQGDVFLARGEWDAAEKAYSTALQLDPSIRRSKSFKARVAKLQENLIALNTSS